MTRSVLKRKIPSVPVVEKPIRLVEVEPEATLIHSVAEEAATRIPSAVAVAMKGWLTPLAVAPFSLRAMLKQNPSTTGPSTLSQASRSNDADG